MITNQSIHPTVLIILDGWGLREDHRYNPIRETATPTMNYLWSHYAHTVLHASGHAVGLPEGQIGNSEVGHLHIGAGRKVPQDLTRIHDSIQHGEFAHNAAFLEAIQYAKQTQRPVHLLGLTSSGGVHSHIEHFTTLIELMAAHQVTCYTHAFLDGRDTPPQSAASSLQQLNQMAEEKHTGHIANIIGRYYAMDRDQRWSRTAIAYDLLTSGKAQYIAPDALTALEMAYARGETDEFVKPTQIQSTALPTPVLIRDNDVIIFMNFRADRARQLCHAINDTVFKGFQRSVVIHPGRFITMTEYAKDLPTRIAFPPINLTNGLGEYLAQHQCRQLRMAETEKYAHVTYFINGGREAAFPREDRILIPSPAVATYDLQPEMSAIELTDKLVQAITSKQYDVIICNYANPDMIGHTGNVTAAAKAVATIDQCLHRVVESARRTQTQLLVTADHGNIEQIYDETTGQPHTAHTNNLVPLIYVGKPAQFIEYPDAALDDIAPTLLYLMGLQAPAEMTGRNLIHLLSPES